MLPLKRAKEFVKYNKIDELISKYVTLERLTVQIGCCMSLSEPVCPKVDDSRLFAVYNTRGRKE